MQYIFFKKLSDIFVTKKQKIISRIKRGGEKEMNLSKNKNILFLIPFIIGFLLLILHSNSFAVTGKCSNCHTMHNSQDGEKMTYDPNNLGPNAMLLRGADCLGCHANKQGSDPVLLLGDANGSIAPCVYSDTTDPGQCLAGGNFVFMDRGTDENYDTLGHNCNVPGLANREDYTFRNFGNVPGFKGQTSDQWNLTVNPLSCAGTFGCHGRPKIKGEGPILNRWQGIKGAHHSNKGGARIASEELETIGGSYRFLIGIAGYEDPDWQHPDTRDLPEQHNEYKGVTNMNDIDSNSTISKLCARCHGVFHSDSADGSTGIGTRPTPDNSGSPWFRHPTDISLPAGTITAPSEYAAYNNGSYSIVAPVGRVDVSAPSDEVNPADIDDDIVTCISCHRAHGSDQPDLLRWNYNDMIAGDATKQGGCFICHTTKNSIQ